MKLPDYRHEPGRIAAHRSLFAEHVEVGAFLYEQRQTRLSASAPEPAGWRSARALEDRLETHVDALFLGRSTALEVCVEHGGEAAGPGELFVALSVFCRRQEIDLVAATLRTLNHGDPARVLAAEHALSLELPPAWIPFVAQALRTGRPGAVALMAGVCAHRRLPLADELLDAFANVPSDRMRIAEALARIGADAARAPLRAALRDLEPDLQETVLRALARLGDADALQMAVEQSGGREWPLLAVALAGGRDDAERVLRGASHAGASRDALWAIGLGGLADGPDVLCSALEQPAQAPFAAQALRWLTGADLHDDVFVPEAVDESLLFDDELPAWRESGVAPARADGSSYGEMQRQWSTDPRRWRAWLAEHWPAMDGQRRCRLGRPHGTEVLVDCLDDARSDPWIRAFAAEELATRFGCPVAFETDLPVRVQEARIAQMRAWTKGHPDTAAAGDWRSARARQ